MPCYDFYTYVFHLPLFIREKMLLFISWITHFFVVFTQEPHRELQRGVERHSSKSVPSYSSFGLQHTLSKKANFIFCLKPNHILHQFTFLFYKYFKQFPIQFCAFNFNMAFPCIFSQVASHRWEGFWAALSLRNKTPPRQTSLMKKLATEFSLLCGHDSDIEPCLAFKSPLDPWSYKRHLTLK